MEWTAEYMGGPWDGLRKKSETGFPAGHVVAIVTGKWANGREKAACYRFSGFGDQRPREKPGRFYFEGYV